MFYFVSKRHRRLATVSSLVLGTLVLAGCAGGSSATPPPPPLSIATTMLPGGQVGNSYSATLAAAGGLAPYTWSHAGGALPAGLSLNAGAGVLAGFPSASVAGVSLSFTVTDSSKPAQSKATSLPLTIVPAALNVTTTSLPNGQIDVPYSAIVAAAGGTPPYNWTLTSGALPAGLSLNAASGAITGTPTALVSNDSLRFTVTDTSIPAQNNPATLLLTIAPPPLSITTTSLPYGQVGVKYTASLAATAGTAPYTWALIGGTLPAGLAFDSSGLISGTPTATATAVPLTFQATDAGSPAQKKQVVLNLNISPMGITVAISPQAAALTVTQMLSVSATTNDLAGVNWTVTPVPPAIAGGSISPVSSFSGANVTLTAPASAGVYTLTATSITDNTVTASIALGVTDLKGVFTWHNDVARDGVNAQEYALTTANVNTASFGKLFSCTVDGAVFAQPLWVANATVAGARHNLVLAATQHDSLYAFDAEASPCAQLWHVNLIDMNHGGTSGEVVVPSAPGCRPNCFVGQGYGNIQPEVGVTSTPVIDPATRTLYVVSKSMNPTCVANNPGSCVFYQRLHAIDFTTGNERPGSPVVIAATFPGGNEAGSVVTYNPRQQNQRASLALVNGTVYVTSGSHEDAAYVNSGPQLVTAPYYGWVIGYTYDGSTFTQSAVFCTTPNAGNGGIWMAGAAPAADSSGNLYVISGNGQFDVTNATGPNNDYGDTFLRLTAALSVSSWFTPSDQQTDFQTDRDAGSGGAGVVLDLPSGSPAHLLIGGGKDGTVYMLNGDAMGGAGDANAWQSFSLKRLPTDGGPNIFSTGAFWNNNFYLDADDMPLKVFAFDPTMKLLNPAWTSQSATAFTYPGGTPSISASGATSNGIIWLLDNASYCTNPASACGPAVLHAYDAINLMHELWNSSIGSSSDAAGNAVKFTVPTVANGRVYVGTRGNNTGGVCSPSTPCVGGLDVYGLKP
jgi:hypothetical protein